MTRHARRVLVRVNHRPWKLVTSLADAGPDDEVFVLDSSAGTITFGDGLHGRRPSSGEQVEVSYREGSGTSGNTSLSFSTTWPPRLARISASFGPNGVRVETSDSVAERFVPLTRPNFFSGRLLTADDLREEQEYYDRARERHNRWLHGWGVVTGLGLSLPPSQSAPTICIEPGFAIDGRGREVVLGELVEASIPECDPPCAWLVVVEYSRRETDWMVSSNGDADPVPSRVEEGALVRLASEPPAEGVAVGRLVRGAGGWEIDSTFVPNVPR